MLLSSYDIVFQEVPGEVTLALNISQCPYHCAGCHSPHLWGGDGLTLTMQLLDELLHKYEQEITCVCFMGGDHQLTMLRDLVVHIKRTRNIKVGVYSGADSFSRFEYIQYLFDYIKVGPYIAELGGLDSPNTNQRMYKKVKRKWIDITNIFQTLNHNGEHLSKGV